MEEMLLIAIKIRVGLNSLSFHRLLGNFPLEEHVFIVVDFEDSFFVISEKAGRNISAEAGALQMCDVKDLHFPLQALHLRKEYPPKTRLSCDNSQVLWNRGGMPVVV